MRVQTAQKQITKLLVMSAAALWLTGCATTYDPAEVCTANWIKPRADQAIGELQKDTASIFRTLRKTAESFSKGKTPSPFQLIALSSSLQKLSKQVTEGSAVKNLKVLAKTCDDPKILTDSLTAFLHDQGLPTQMVSFIEDLPRYQKMVEGLVKSLDLPSDANIR